METVNSYLTRTLPQTKFFKILFKASLRHVEATFLKKYIDN